MGVHLVGLSGWFVGKLLGFWVECGMLEMVVLCFGVCATCDLMLLVVAVCSPVVTGSCQHLYIVYLHSHPRSIRRLDH